MLKLLGAAMVVAASGLSGLAVAGSYARRPRELRALRSALQMLETEITYGATCLTEALETVASRCEQSVRPLFKQAGMGLAANTGVSAAETWEEALAGYYPASALKPQDHSILTNLGRSLGRSDSENQVKHLRLTMEQVAQEASKAEEEASRNVKIWSYLGFLGGLVIVLVVY